MANVITTKLDLDGKGFLTQIKTVKASIMEAEGATGKLKASASGLGGVLKENVAAAAMAAGTALLTFAVKSVQAFQQLALESGKFADATGINVEEASRLAEVAGDLGVDLGTLQGAFQKFNKSAADGVVDIENFGNTLVRASDGSLDAYQSFINTATAIGAIENPARRAEAAQEAFGRSYGEIAELMEMDAKDLRAALDAVGEGKVISEEELAKARAFREGLDRVKDAVDEVTLAVGGAVAGNSALLETFADTLGVIAKYADEAMRLADAYLTVTNPIYSFNRVLGLAADEIDLTSMSLEELQAKLKNEGFSTEQIERATLAWKEANTAAADATTSVAGYNAEVSRNAALEVTAAENRRRNAESSRYQAEATAILTKRLEDYLAELGSIPADIYTEIQAALNSGDLARAEALLNELARTRIAKIGIAIDSGVGAGVAAATGKLVGNAVSASIAAAVAGTKMPSSLGGGGGGGGGGASPAETEAEKWDDAIAKAYEYGEITTQQYIDYLTQRLTGEDRYSDTYYRLWKERQGLEQMLDDQAERRRKDQEAAEKEAADAAEKARKDAEETTKALEKQQQALGNLIINVTNTSADPQSVVRAIEQARRMFGNRWLTG